MFSDISPIRFFYVAVLLFIGLASKEILVADPALLVAITFLIFSYVAVTKLGPSTKAFFSSHEESLRGNLLSTLDGFKAEVAANKAQEEVLELSALVAASGAKSTQPLFNTELNPYVSGVYASHLKEDAFLTLAHTDLAALSNSQDKEQQRRLNNFLTKFIIKKSKPASSKKKK